MATEAEAVKDNRNTPFGDDKRRVLDVHYTDRDTKLFVENGRLVEEKIQRPSQVCPNSGLIYTCSTPPKRPPPSKADIEAQDIETAEVALKHYNTKHKLKYELVEAINSGANLWACGLWFHCNFKAKVKGCSASSTKMFFAELKVAKFVEKTRTTKYLVTACRPLAGKTTKQCKMCGDDGLIHPTYGFRQGRYAYQTRALRTRDNGKVLSVSKHSKVSAFRAEGEAPPSLVGPSYCKMINNIFCSLWCMQPCLKKGMAYWHATKKTTSNGESELEVFSTGAVQS